MGIDPPSVLASFFWSVNTNPDDRVRCLPDSNWYLASFYLEAVKGTDWGWERMPALYVSLVAYSSLSRFSNHCCIESFLSQISWLGPHCSVSIFLLQFHYPKLQVAWVDQGLLQVWMQFSGWRTHFDKQACCMFACPVQTICSQMACLAKTSGVWTGLASVTGILFCSSLLMSCP